MIDTNLAIEIADLQSDICAGGLKRADLLERLSVIKNKSIGIDPGRERASSPGCDAIVDGYRQDAIEQLQALLSMVGVIAEVGELPPMKLVRISCCAELLTAKIMRYFRARNDVATLRMIAKIRED